ncbi:hypothetical protein UlMin_046062 [Ulmus minor]
MKKVFDQTVRDLKREVNKKVLKVPGIEQKVLDATSNEPWGPHGSLLADIALATRNYHEYQMIMSVVWKRINDTGKNWRHVYKALTVLEYLVAHGSERVIDEIREHAYQISTLSDFQYIDSTGKDQGSNVRKKSQSLVALVNDKERIIEVRQKAAANRDKFRSPSSSGGMYRPGGGYGDRYDDDRYGGRDEDRNGYGREREWGYRDEDRYGRNGDSYGHDGDRYGREYEERYGRDGYREDDYRGRSQSVDDNQYGTRSRSSDRDRRSFDDDASSRGARTDEFPQDGRRLDRKFSEQNIGAPPSYEEVVSESRSPVHSERDGETPATSAPRASSPPVSNHPTASPPASNPPNQATNVPATSASPANQEVQAFDEFDPRGSVPAAPVTSNSSEVDLLGSLTDSLALVPTVSVTPEPESNTNFGSAPTFAAAPLASNIPNQSNENPFGDAPFKAIPTANGIQAPPHADTSTASFQVAGPPQADAPKADPVANFGFGDSFSSITYSTPSFSTVQTPTNSQFTNQNTDILADILPPSGPSPAITSQTPFSAPPGQQVPQPGANAFGYQVQPGSIVPVPSNTVPPNQTSIAGQPGFGNYLPPGHPPPVTAYMVPQVPSGPTQYNGGNFTSQGGFGAPNNANFYSQQGASVAPFAPQVSPQNPMGPAGQVNSGGIVPQVAHQAPPGPALGHGNDLLANLSQTVGANPSITSQHSLPSSTGSNALVTQPSKDKFDPKSSVWADTLSRGLVNLNISGAKINPLADIGIDFDAINRKEKRLEKPTATPVTSTVTMGKAMGSGSGIGRASAGALRPSPNMMGSGMGMGMGMGMGGVPGGGMNMGGGYGGINQPMGMGRGMGMNMPMGQGVPMQQPAGLPPGSNISSGYNPMMGGGGGYAPQQPYGGGYAPQQPYGGGYR